MKCEANCTSCKLREIEPCNFWNKFHDILEVYKLNN